MKSLKVDFKNCYGIKSLEHIFDFSESKKHLVYAPNGTMKTSFANTMMDYNQGIETVDKVYGNARPTARLVLDDECNEINPKTICVIESYKPSFDNERMSTLLVNKELKEKYDSIHSEIIASKEQLLNKVLQLSGIKEGIELEFTRSFKGNDFLEVIEMLETQLDFSKPTNFGSLIYNNLFNEKTEKFLKTKKFNTLLQEYIEKYDALLDNSKFLKKGIFNHNNAENVSKVLDTDGFFDAEHSVVLNLGTSTEEINSMKAFADIIEEEKKAILTDNELSKRFIAVDKAITKNKDLKEFRVYLEKNPDILVELKDLEGFKKEIWKSYLCEAEDLYKGLLEVYKKGKADIAKIGEEATKQRTSWEKVISIFNSRFYVPFKLEVANKRDVILNNDIPVVTFKFKGPDGEIDVERSILFDVLSKGEERALYLLQVIFEIQSRIEEKQETIFIVDDIADSFDYRNKYAIIEYLCDIVKEDYFYKISLTHNYDFFRTLQSRLSISKKFCVMATKDEDEIKLNRAEYYNPLSYFRSKYTSDKKIFIATIPFARNIIEYTKGKKDSEYLKLTSLLHLKTDSMSYKVQDMHDLYNNVFYQSKKNNFTSIENNSSVVKLIYDTCDTILSEKNTYINLENKLVLSIGTRLKAEEHMINKINNSAFTSTIKSNQTRVLHNKYEELFSTASETLSLLEQVNLITPENIHLNSFMYEPLLDMSELHLRELYKRVKKLI